MDYLSVGERVVLTCPAPLLTPVPMRPSPGLAEAAKSIGSAIRSFQPTIREVAQISSELKSTLEQEIGLDDLKNELKGVPPTSQPAPRAFAEDKVRANCCSLWFCLESFEQ